MKKRKLTGLLALASCVTLIAGCDLGDLSALKFWEKKAEEQKEEVINNGSSSGDQSSGDQSSGGQSGGDQGGSGDQGQGGSGDQGQGGGGGDVTPVVPSMVVGDLPEKVEVGKTLDLEDYVTLTNATAFEVELAEGMEGLASVEGHVVTVLGEGTISFTVKSGELSKACSVKGFRASRERLENYFKDVGKRYEVAIMEYEEGESEEDSGWESSDYLVHGDNFVLSQTFALDDYESPTAYVPGGFLAYDDLDAFMFGIEFVPGESENDYSVEVFNMNFDMDKTSSSYGYPVQVTDPVNISPSYYSSRNGEFGVDFSSLAYEYDEELGLDLYVLEGENGIEASNFAERALWQSYGTYTFDAQNELYGAIVRIEFVSIDFAEEGEDPDYGYRAFVYAEDPTSESEEVEITPVMITDFYAGEDYDGIPEVDALIEAGKPELPDYADIVSTAFDAPAGTLSVSNLVLSSSASSVLGQTGLISLEYGWASYNSETHEYDYTNEAPADLWGYFQYFPLYGSKTVFASETSVWEVEELYDLTDPDHPEFAGYKPVSGVFEHTVEEEGQDPVKVDYDVFTSDATESGYFLEESDAKSAWENEKLTFNEFANPAYYSAGGFAAGMVYVQDETYYGSMWYLNSWRAEKLFENLYSSDSGLALVGTIRNIYAKSGMDIHDYFQVTISTGVPSSGYTSFTFDFGWSNTEIFRIELAFQVADVTAYTSAYEAQFSALIA